MPPAGSRASPGSLAAAVAVLAGILYLGTLGHGFAYDDAIVVERQDVVRSGRVLEAFTTPYHHGPEQRVPTFLYRPLTIASLALNVSLHGLHPAGYHAVNVLLHATVSALVLLLGLAAGLEPVTALAGALIFAVHPVHAEAVAAVAGRADLLATLFSVLALLAYARLRNPTGRPTAVGLGAASVLFFLALLSKESAIALPVAALVWDLLVLRPEGERPAAFIAARSRAFLLSAAAFLAPIAAYLALRASVLGGLLVPPSSMTHVENPMVGLALPERLLTAVVVAGRCLGLLLFPRRLSPDYGYAEITPVTSPLEPRFLLVAGLLALVAAVLGLAWKRSRTAAFLAVLTLATWGVVSNLFLVIGTVMAERLLYLPSVGFCLLAGMAWAALARRIPRPWAVAAGIFVLTLAAARTFTAAAAWRSDLSLFSAALKAAPRSVRVLGNLAGELAGMGRLEEARSRLVEAVRIAPDFVPNLINLSGVYLKMGGLDAAEQVIRHALEIEPRNPVVLLQLGLVRERRGDPESAEEAYRRATEADPGLADARLRLAGLALGRGDLELARQQLEAVLARDPGSSAALRGLGLVALRRGDARAAVEYLERAAGLSPGDPAIRRDLGEARRAAGG